MDGNLPVIGQVVLHEIYYSVSEQVYLGFATVLIARIVLG
jgi:hypothetical protein